MATTKKKPNDVPSFKTSAFRSEFRTIKGVKYNYLVLRFWDKGNWEYHVFAEVVAKKAARDVAKQLGVVLINDKRKDEGGNNIRQLWDQIWDEKLILQKLSKPK